MGATKASLNPEQKAAVEYLEGPLLVLAGPGTGKTQLLSAKVAYILENTDANPENILCLTFTEAGAENMRDRLQSMIGTAAQNVNIYTYHAFGCNLLERYRNYAENFERELNSAIDETTQYKIVATIQDKLPAMDILRTAATRDIIEIIGNAKAARLSADDLKKIAERNSADSVEISTEVSEILSQARRGARYPEAVEKTYLPIGEVLARFVRPKPIAGDIESIGNVLARELSNAIDEVEQDVKHSVKPLGAWKTKFFEKTEDGTFRLKDYIANKKLASLANIMEKYDQKLKEDGLYDFNDMIEQTIQFLKTDRGFRLSLSELFQYILLDEFQDTNTSQFELIKLITDYEKPVIMAVGDDDQAIYEFQGANASNLMDFQSHYDAKIITLTKNYRSLGGILGLSRHIAKQINDSFANSYQFVNKNLQAMKEQTTPGAEADLRIERHEFLCGEAEYYWVAEKIKYLLDSGEDPTEIAILAPKHKNLVAILPYLKAQNIDITYEKRENLLQDERILPIITLANFVHKLANNKPASGMLLEALSYDFWELDLLEVMKIFPERYITKPALEILEKGGEQYPALKKLAQFFANLAAKSLITPLEIWLDYLIGNNELDGYKSPYLDYYRTHLSSAELLEFYESLSTLRNVVMTHSASIRKNNNDSVLKLEDFVTTIADYQNSGSEIMRTSNYRDNSQSIQVMTAFKSKGLEFKHVFLISLDDLAWGKSKGNNNLLALPKNLTKIRHTGVTDDEKLRVLFVAMTRAKASLIMTNARAASNGKRLARLGYLNESSIEAEEQLSPFLPENLSSINLHLDELDDVAKIKTLDLGWRARYCNFTPPAEELQKARVQNYRLSATDLSNFIDLIYAGPQVLYEKIILNAPSEPSTLKQSYGTLIHQVFEQITNTGCDDETAIIAFEDGVKNINLEDEDKAKLAEFGSHSLNIALKDFGEILRHPNAKAEVNFSPEHIIFDGVPLVGKIDHLEIDQKNKTIEVYDFKTGKYHPEKWNKHPTLYKYQLQLGFYKLLLNLSPTYRNYRVTRGHILFVTPDDESKVYDRPYEYNEDDEQELKDLIRAVYRQIITLNFIKDNKIFLPPNKDNNMSRIQEFVAELLENTV